LLSTKLTVSQLSAAQTEAKAAMHQTLKDLAAWHVRIDRVRKDEQGIEQLNAVVQISMQNMEESVHTERGKLDQIRAEVQDELNAYSEEHDDLASKIQV